MDDLWKSHADELLSVDKDDLNAMIDNTIAFLNESEPLSAAYCAIEINRHLRRRNEQVAKAFRLALRKELGLATCKGSVGDSCEKHGDWIDTDGMCSVGRRKAPKARRHLNDQGARLHRFG